jgi:Putative transposase
VRRGRRDRAPSTTITGIHRPDRPHVATEDVSTRVVRPRHTLLQLSVTIHLTPLARTAVVGVSLRVVLGFLRRRARQAGVRGGRSGAVAIIQRFGGALNLNVHIHALVMDGVLPADGAILRFHAAPRLTRADVATVVAEVARRIERLLQRRGLSSTPEAGGVTDRWKEEAPSLAGLAAAVQGLLALGPQAGARVARFGSPPEAVVPTPVGPCHTQAAGFDLHAGIVDRAGGRARLERLCRDALRPPLAQARCAATRRGPSGSDCGMPGQMARRICDSIPWRSTVVASAGSAWSDVAPGVNDGDVSPLARARHRRGICGRT